MEVVGDDCEEACPDFYSHVILTKYGFVMRYDASPAFCDIPDRRIYKSDKRRPMSTYG